MSSGLFIAHPRTDYKPSGLSLYYRAFVLIPLWTMLDARKRKD